MITNNYEDYTKRRQYTKSITLELIPQGRTRETISEQNLLEYDKSLYQMAEEIRPAIDEVLKMITDKALEQISCEFGSYYKIYARLSNPNLTAEEKRNLNYKKNTVRNILLEEIKKEIVFSMPGSLKIPQLNSAEFIFEILPTLLEKYKIKDAAVYSSKLSALKGCTPLFATFMVSRITILETSIPERVLENLDIYFENMASLKLLEGSMIMLPSKISEDAQRYSHIENYNIAISQKGIDAYNSMISGEYNEDGTKIFQGINEKINELNQENLADKNYDGPIFKKLKKLHKQIMTESQKIFTIAEINSDEELKTLLKNAMKTSKEPLARAVSLMGEKDLVKKSVIDGRNLHELSHLLSKTHETITELLEARYLVQLQEKYKGKTSKRYLNALKKGEENANFVIRNSSHPFESIMELGFLPKDLLLTSITSIATDKYSKIVSNEIPDSFFEKDTKIKGSAQNVDYCKRWLDSIVEFRNFIKLFITQNEISILSDELESVLEGLVPVQEAYNMARNYITRSMKKSAKTMRCCFGTPLKMDKGTWYHGKDKITRKNNTIVRKNGKYYFLTLPPTTKPLTFETGPNDSNTHILLIKKGQQAFRQVPKILFKDAKTFFEEHPEENVFVLSRFVKEKIVISRKVYEIYKNKLFKTPGNKATEEEISKYKENLKCYLEICKRFCENYLDYSTFNMQNIPEADTYNNSNDFFNEIDTRTISMNWHPISEKQLDELVENGQVLLFLINNRNMYQKGRNKTSYACILLSILDEKHCKNPKIRLNARAAITYREALTDGKITHKAGSIVVNKKDSEGNPIPPHIHQEIYYYYNKKITLDELSEEAKRLLDTSGGATAVYHKTKHDLIRNRRYSREQFTIQLSYNVNNQIPEDSTRLLNKQIERERESKNILTLGRGTQDLLYYSLSDAKGNILEHGNLNTIHGVDYAQLLKSKTREGIVERTNWDYSKNTKNIKESYIRHIISKVTKMALENNAIILVENIPTVVKNRYTSLDNQIFKGFEKKLNEKLMNISFKDKVTGEPGSFENPIQLSLDNNSYQKGLLYHVSGSYCRSRCPETGFVSRFHWENCKTITSKRKLLESLEDISYIPEEKIFKFSFDYEKCGIKTEKEERKKWTVVASGPRIYNNPKTGELEYVKDISEEYSLLLKKELKDGWNDKLSEIIPTMTSQAITLLFDLFVLTTSGRVSDPITHKIGYISPITGTYYDNISYVMTINLLNNFIKSKAVSTVETLLPRGIPCGG